MNRVIVYRLCDSLVYLMDMCLPLLDWQILGLLIFAAAGFEYSISMILWRDLGRENLMCEFKGEWKG